MQLHPIREAPCCNDPETHPINRHPTTTWLLCVPALHLLALQFLYLHVYYIPTSSLLAKERRGAEMQGQPKIQMGELFSHAAVCRLQQLQSTQQSTFFRHFGHSHGSDYVGSGPPRRTRGLVLPLPSNLDQPTLCDLYVRT